MPLIRKKPDDAAAPAGNDLESRLTSPSADTRWGAARDAADRPENVHLLSQALARETDIRVREAIFTSLAKIGSPESVNGLVLALHSDEANLRTGAMDALRLVPAQIEEYLPQLLTDADSDVRVLACDLAREVSATTAQSLLCALVDKEPHANVCA
ncbi:MAG TPA: HEAT repeat domain-containing protein, partial [Rhizomicrobium sp.]